MNAHHPRTGVNIPRPITAGWDKLLRARSEIAAIAELAQEDPLVRAADRWVTLRKFAPALLEAVDFKATRGSGSTLAAIETLREMNRSGRREVPKNAQMPFKKEWRTLVATGGKIDRRLWETATMAHLRNKLRSGDVWVERSANYRRFDSYLLPTAKVAPIAADLGLPATADEWIVARERELDWRLKRFAHRLARDKVEGVTFENGKLSITPVRADNTDVDALANRIDGLMPRVRITELLHEVAAETGFTAAFDNLRTHERHDNPNALLAAILADGSNLGLARMAEASQCVTPDQLTWTQSAYIRPETYKAALARIIDAHHALPIAAVWGQGTTSSSDALQETGRVERTLFMLDWLESPVLRQRCQAGLNKSEQRHALTGAICTFKQGRIADRTHETQQFRALGLNVVIAAIVYWNSAIAQAG